MEYDIKKLQKEGYGSQLVCDEKGNVIDEYCNHYFSPRGRCIFCDALEYMSSAYCELHGCDPF